MSYFGYLKEILGLSCDDNLYNDLFYVLLHTNFFLAPSSCSKYDRNRVSDGLALRSEYAFSFKGDLSFSDSLYDDFEEIRREECSVFEVLVALARRMENDFMYDPTQGDRTGLWMKVMLDNLGIGQYKGVLSKEALDNVFTSVGTFMSRTYKPDGSGGLFPLKYPEKNQREVQIWDQMRAYLRENYL